MASPPGAMIRALRLTLESAATQLRGQRLRPVGIKGSELLLGHLESVGLLRRRADDQPERVLVAVVEDLSDVLGFHKHGREGLKGQQLIVDTHPADPLQEYVELVLLEVTVPGRCLACMKAP